MRERLGGAIAPTLAFAAVLVLWQASVWLLRPPPFILPGIGQVIARLVAFGPNLAGHVVATIEGIALGFLAAVVFGTAGAVLIVSSDTLRRAITPRLVTIQILPKIAFPPPILVWFWSGRTPPGHSSVLLECVPV